jgi:hypothetical protein
VVSFLSKCFLLPFLPTVEKGTTLDVKLITEKDWYYVLISLGRGEGKEE